MKTSAPTGPHTRRAMLVFASVAIASSLFGCGSAPPPRPSAGRVHVPPAAREPRRALPIPSTLELDAQGREAIQVLGNAPAFGGAGVGYAGTPVPEVAALRTLLADRHAADALSVVIEHGTLPGQLMALSGMYHADHERFATYTSRYRSVGEPVTVLWDGCLRGADVVPAQQLLERAGAVRLQGPRDTMGAWVERTGALGQPVTFDIVGGGYPAHLRGSQQP